MRVSANIARILSALIYVAIESQKIFKIELLLTFDTNNELAMINRIS